MTIIEALYNNREVVLLWHAGELRGDPEAVSFLKDINDVLPQVGPIGGPHTRAGRHLSTLLSAVVLINTYLTGVRLTGELPEYHPAPPGAIN
jgi:hypothetical protein